jgi:hypothetical protein
MAELNSSALMNGTTAIVNPNDVNKIYTDPNDRSVIDEMTLTLKPLEKTMRRALNRRGINGNDLSYNDVITTFYNEFARPKNVPAKPNNYLTEHPFTAVKVSSFDPVNHADAVTDAGAIVTSVTDLIVNTQNIADAKKAQAIADAGGYNTLTPQQKSLIAIPAYINAPSLTAEQAALANDSLAVKNSLLAKATSVTGMSTKTVIYVVLGAVVLAILYLIFK